MSVYSERRAKDVARKQATKRPAAAPKPPRVESFPIAPMAPTISWKRQVLRWSWWCCYVVWTFLLHLYRARVPKGYRLPMTPNRAAVARRFEQRTKRHKVRSTAPLDPYDEPF